MIGSCSAIRRWVWAGALLGFAVVSLPAVPLHGVAAAQAVTDGGVPKFDTESPSATAKAECMQKCFDKYTGNVGRCYKTFCSYLLGIVLLSCDEARLAHCEDQAEEIYEQCKRGCKNLP